MYKIKYRYGGLEEFFVCCHNWHQNFKAPSYTLLYCLFLSGIQIGFAQEIYSFNEPDSDLVVRDVILIRNRQTEQMFGVQITVDGPLSNIGSASLGIDYRLQNNASTILLLFLSTTQNVSFSFILNSDELSEATEGFQATAMPAEGFPDFMLPQVGGAFGTTEVQILGDRVTPTCPGNLLVPPHICS